MRKVSSLSRKMGESFIHKDMNYRPALIPISVIGILFSGFEVIYIPTLSTVESCLYLVVFILFCLLPLQPVLFSILIVLTGNMLSLSFTIQQHDAPFVFTCILIALGVLAADVKLFYVLATFTFSVVIHLIYMSLADYLTTFIVLSVPSIYTTAIFTGMIIKLWKQAATVKQKQLESEIELHKLANLRQRDRIAIQLHDSLTNELTNISYIARNVLNEDGILSESMKENWTLVLSQTQTAFQQVHRIISLLSDPDLHSELTVSFNERIRDVAFEQEKYLLEHGYDGHIEVIGLVDLISEELAEEVISLLTELSNNIRRHSIAGKDSFDIFISLKPDLIAVRSLNDCMASKGVSEDEKSGRGLQLHEREIHRLGGKFSTRLEEGVWMLYAEFPIETIA